MNRLRTAALTSWGALMLLSLAWEPWLAPSTYAPAAFWTVIKILPLLLLGPALLGRGYRAYLYGCLVALPYFSEGVMLAWSDAGTVRLLALTEILLVLVFFTTAALYVRRRREAEATAA
jgi:uncharacterized membrane protein